MTPNRNYQKPSRWALVSTTWLAGCSFIFNTHPVDLLIGSLGSLDTSNEPSRADISTPDGRRFYGRETDSGPSKEEPAN